jgi:putative exosortase-associated protein (TIGR04073 family)
MFKKLFLVVVVLQLIVSPLYAQEFKALRKLGKGLINTVSAMTEIPKQLAEGKKDDGTRTTFSHSLLKGFSLFLGKAGMGAYQIATFALPPYGGQDIASN